MQAKMAYPFTAAVILALVALPPALSQESNWIGLVSVVDANTKADYTTKPVLTGGVYNFTFKVTVPFGAPDELIMYTPLNQSGSQYWYLKDAYQGIDLTTWTPARSAISFKQVKGNGTFSLIGVIPINVTLRYANWDGKSIVLHFANESYPIVTLRLRSSGDRVGALVVTATDQAIANYQAVLKSKEELAKTPNIENTYSAFLNGALNEAKGIYRKGYVSEATRILNSIPNKVPLNPEPPPPPPPPPPESPLPLILGGAFAAALVVAILTAFLTLRARSQLAVVKNNVHEEAIKLDNSLVKLERLDKSLASSIEAIRNRLKDVSA